MNDDYGSGAAAGIAIGLTIFGIELVLFAAFYVVYSIALMRLFRKTGVEPWAGWVPIFNTWRLFELGGYPGWWAVLSLVPFVNYVAAVFLYIAAYRIGLSFGKDGVWVVLFIFLPFVWCFLLARQSEVYLPATHAARGYPAPLIGYGAAQPGYASTGYPPAPPPPPAA